MKVANTPTENQTQFPTESDCAPPPRAGAGCRVVETSHNAIEREEGRQVPPHRFGSPTERAGEVTNPADCSGYAPDPLAELKKDPDYVKLTKDLEFFESIEDGLYLIDQNFGGFGGANKNDQAIGLWNIEDAARDRCAPGHDAAVKLLNNPRLRAMMDANGDGVFSGAELTNLIAGLKAVKKEMEGAVTSPPASSGAGSPPAPTGTAGEGNTTSAAEGQQTATAQEGKELTAEEVTQALNQKTPRPAMTVGGGLEGATENMSKTLGWMESEFDRLTVLMGQTSDPKLLKEIEAACNKLSRQMQTVSSMMNQLMTMMSNLSKMFSDVAMNSIRNMR